MRVAPFIKLSAPDAKALIACTQDPTTPPAIVLRARIVLLAAQGLENRAIAAQVGTNRQTVGRWRHKFAHQGLAAVMTLRASSGRKPLRRHALADVIIHKTTTQKPPSAPHWTTRTLAAELGINPSLVHRVWKDAGIRPQPIAPRQERPGPSSHAL